KNSKAKSPVAARRRRRRRRSWRGRRSGEKRHGGLGSQGGHHHGGAIDGKSDPSEDDRGDPDVIPAQFVSNDGEDSSFNSSKWPNGSY
ncbi:hypothetical protein quinque_015787, partial [Culex quinquefasciatus]